MISRFLSSQFSGYLFIAAIFIVAGMVYYIRNGGYQSCLTDQLAKSAGVQSEKAEIEIEVRRLDNDALVRRYCKWVYDIPYSECVRSVAPIERIKANEAGHAINHDTQRGSGE